MLRLPYYTQVERERERERAKRKKGTQYITAGKKKQVNWEVLWVYEQM